MSFWATQIKLRKPAHRMIAALIGGAVVEILTNMLVDPLVFHWIGWPPPPGLPILLMYFGITIFVTLYMTVWFCWWLTPGCIASAWSHIAILIAATAAWFVDAAFSVPLKFAWPDSQFLGMAFYLITEAGPLALAGVFAIWFFGRLKPNEEGPIARRKRRERVEAGLCGTCGYNLRGLTDSRCPECFTAFDPTSPPQLPPR